MIKNKKLIKNLVIIFGIIIIPLIYSLFYLKAFWDPYGNLDKLPVAIVDKDNGAQINSINRNIGKELENTMNDNKTLKYNFVSEKEANNGLTSGKYYAVIVIPEDFSKDIASSSTSNKIQADLIYTPNEKTNYLASQILNKAMLQLSDSVKSNVDEQIVNSLTTNLQSVPNKLTDINNGITTLYNGAKDLDSGAINLKNGINQLNNNYVTFNSSIFSLTDAVKSLDNGASDLNNGINLTLNGVNTLNTNTKDLYKISESAQQLSKGTSDLSTSVSNYVDGVNGYISQNNQIMQILVNYIANNPTSLSDNNIKYIYDNVINNKEVIDNINLLSNSGTKIKSGANDLNKNMSTFSDGTQSLSQINPNIALIENSIKKLSDGSNSIYLGINKLSSGVSTLTTYSNQIKNGITNLNNGANSLSSGTNSLKNGLNEANNNISDGIETTKLDLKNVTGLGDFSKNPVDVKQDTLNSVENYGTAFSPYFMSLSLWVGSLILFVGIHFDSRFKILSKNSNRKILRTIIYMLICVLQAILLALSLRLFLKLEVNNIALYYLMTIFISIVFFSIVQFLMITFKDVGKLLSIVLLVIQLSASGGTFPIELVAKPFSLLYKFVPMTYSVRIFREVIIGGNTAILIKSTLILFIIFLVFFAATLFIEMRRDKRKLNKKEKEEYIVDKISIENS